MSFTQKGVPHEQFSAYHQVPAGSPGSAPHRCNRQPVRRGLPSQTALGNHAEDFIADDHLASLLSRPADRQQVRDVIAKSLDKQPLTVAEAAVLMSATEPDLIAEIFEAAQAQEGRVRTPDRALRAFVHRQPLRERLQATAGSAGRIARPFGGRSTWPRCASRSRLSKTAATSG